ncbi:MAG: methyltransferase domain-containing protein [Patescibacteria group bacterium]|nr:methyltransferase domain-containing protein [Patescibacteria group bacterium]
MERRKIKLNLGCGIFYKPGYLNIDKFNPSVADKIFDVEDLPFAANSIETIEAYHLIEHFDYIHCKYVLSEWFRILKPKGILIIETPNLEETFKKFKSSNSEGKKTTLQWIYGIDSPGMQHKTGFNWELIKNLLTEIGFENIARERPSTHLYEPGMRVICQKPENFSEKQLSAHFRKRLKKELKIDDSYLLFPLENWISEMFNIYFEGFKGNKKNCLNKIIGKISICHPIVPINPLNYWNMARLKVILNYEVEKIENDYKNALFFISDKKIKNRITIELNNALNKRSNLVPKIPISEDYQGEIL